MSERSVGTRKHHPLVELTLARMREFMREPEAVFWVFIFPVILALALGIAFRNRPPEKIKVAVEDRIENAATLIEILKTSPDLEPAMLSADDAALALRAGKIELVVAPGEEAESAPVEVAASGNPVSPTSYTFRFELCTEHVEQISCSEHLQCLCPIRTNLRHKP